MYSYSVMASTDEQKAQFSAFFVRYREHFSRDMLLDEALLHLLNYLEQSSIILTYNERDQVIGALNYWRTADETGEDEFAYDADGRLVYLSSALIAPEERSSRVFMHGFRDWINEMHKQAPELHTVIFTARADMAYINQLYRKFARHCGHREGLHGMENIYKANFTELHHFLNRLKSK